MRKVVAALGALMVAGVGVGPAIADEAKTPVSASMLLNILSAPIQPREAAYDQSIKDEGPPPRSSLGVVQPDGSVKYGSVSVTVRNPCPPGTAHYEPPPLPGRRARN
ncbi:MAG: hypothetical protein AUH29_05020 [Candidatus Rokubacteria bacterium 13_1_40CM_69_27]|nr:MAG: hypothetical protein AUH29_05020 [Candidatus Rokubacteria bacterium 13_1_40CM_69_27]OLC33405.1 MAG: hypothetical protein AUH81_14295 [Candidatus Rokubacteria bacterium 13_1_40CM_4_69_5]OLE37027.1 MAG: hypothetical protein AUG00_09315 [Candidatus Rokubacteria bacterium 13_1_20CM_2_70_7]